MGSKVKLEFAQKRGRVPMSGCFIIMVSFYARSKDILSRVKARHKEYALGTVHGSLLRELKVV